MVQSPTLTLVWVVALNNTLMPLVSFTIDTHGFCKRFSRPEAVLLMIYTVFCVSCAVVGPGWFDVFDIYDFYPMPFHFMWRAYMLALCCVICYFWTFRCIRVVWDKYGPRASCHKYCHDYAR